MREQALTIIKNAAQAAGLAPDKVLLESQADNITLPRPRIDVAYLPETFTRTGRKLAVTLDGTRQTRKVEVYQVDFPLTVTVQADDEAWLDLFSPAFVRAFPRGVNAAGNWVKIRVTEAAWEGYRPKRVGGSIIQPFVRRSRIITVRLTWRVAEDQVQNLITGFTFNPTYR